MCRAKELKFYPKMRNIQRALGHMYSSVKNGLEGARLEAGRQVRKLNGPLEVM